MKESSNPRSMVSFEVQLLTFLKLCQNRSEVSMTPHQYARVASIARDRNMLVFGAGFDAAFWETITRHLTILENDPEWIHDGEVETIPVSYRGCIGLPLDHPDTILKQIEHLNRDWHAILVDGPRGYAAGHPGREETIYAAAEFRARSGAAVLVHDYERDWERSCCDRFLGEPDEYLHSEIEGDPRVLAIWRGKVAEAI